MAQTFTSLTDPALLELIQSGAVGVLPTDTVYGLVAKATNPEALQRFFTAKPRHNEPGTIIGASVQQFEALGFQPATLQATMQYWPNPVSVVLDATEVSRIIKQHRTTLPLRIPAPTALQALLAQTGPLMTTSANLHGQPVATTVDEARRYFGTTVDFYVDGGAVDHESSAIIEVMSDHRVVVHRTNSSLSP